jgi:hypothetical protein
MLANHPFAKRELNVRDENGNEGCAICGRSRDQHPLTGDERAQLGLDKVPASPARPSGPSVSVLDADLLETIQDILETLAEAKQLTWDLYNNREGLEQDGERIAVIFNVLARRADAILATTSEPESVECDHELMRWLDPNGDGFLGRKVPNKHCPDCGTPLAQATSEGEK